jgi:hypothetical protein
VLSMCLGLKLDLEALTRGTWEELTKTNLWLSTSISTRPLN